MFLLFLCHVVFFGSVSLTGSNLPLFVVWHPYHGFLWRAFSFTKQRSIWSSCPSPRFSYYPNIFITKCCPHAKARVLVHLSSLGAYGHGTSQDRIWALSLQLSRIGGSHLWQEENFLSISHHSSILSEDRTIHSTSSWLVRSSQMKGNPSLASLRKSQFQIPSPMRDTTSSPSIRRLIMLTLLTFASGWVSGVILMYANQSAGENIQFHEVSGGLQ